MIGSALEAMRYRLEEQLFKKLQDRLSSEIDRSLKGIEGRVASLEERVEAIEAGSSQPPYDTYFAIQQPPFAVHSQPADTLFSQFEGFACRKYVKQMVESVNRGQHKHVKACITDGSKAHLLHQLSPGGSGVKCLVWGGIGVNQLNNSESILFEASDLSSDECRRPAVVIVCMKYGAADAAKQLLDHGTSAVAWVSVDLFSQEGIRFLSVLAKKCVQFFTNQFQFSADMLQEFQIQFRGQEFGKFRLQVFLHQSSNPQSYSYPENTETEITQCPDNTVDCSDICNDPKLMDLHHCLRPCDLEQLEDIKQAVQRRHVAVLSPGNRKYARAVVSEVCRHCSLNAGHRSEACACRYNGVLVAQRHTRNGLVATTYNASGGSRFAAQATLQ